MLYRPINDFNIIQKFEERGPLNKHYIAEEKQDTFSEHPLYTKQWYIVLRKGAYEAQKDKAFSSLIIKFLGYGPEGQIIQDDKDFYYGSRAIKGFVEWNTAYNPVNKTILGYALQADGSFIKNGVRKQLTGLAAIGVLGWYFADIDFNTGGFGIVETETELKAFKIDNANAGNSRVMNYGLNREDIEALPGFKVPCFDFHVIPEEIVLSESYQKEKQMMLRKIAVAEFAEMETIIRHDVTSNAAESGRWCYSRMAQLMPDNFPADAKLELPEEKECGSDRLIEKMQMRHLQLQTSMAAEPNPIPQCRLFLSHKSMAIRREIANARAFELPGQLGVAASKNSFGV
jgi:hypothetical protein